MTSITNEFRHQPLDYSRRQIRLVQVSTNNATDVPECQLITRDRWGSYNALSYVWGTDEPKHKILIDGKVCWVRRNLYSFLLQASRGPLSEKPTWIDALCIDQSNIDERNYQVRQLTKIYSKADSVTIWLNPHNNGAIETLTSFNVVYDKLCQSPDDLVEERYSDVPGTILKSSFSQFCYDEYWSRLWTVPEVLSAVQISIACGDQILEGWHKLAHVREADSSPYTYGFKHSYATNLSRLLDHRYYYWRGHKDYHGFLNLFEAFGNYACTDRRDRVFALLALSGQADLSIDYRSDELQLFLHLLNPVSLDRLGVTDDKVESFIDCLRVKLLAKAFVPCRYGDHDIWATPVSGDKNLQPLNEEFARHLAAIRFPRSAARLMSILAPKTQLLGDVLTPMQIVEADDHSKRYSVRSRLP